MATSTHTESRRKYSWWWDSHISPKNSRWLQENLTDMDAIVKQMIKVIEEDADSFARRAEMYYKKRPELMKLVEEFYRAYRALAERYDHATGVIRQAHRTMSEAFPNQVPLVLADDSPAGYASADPNPHTPEVLPLKCAAFESKELEKDAFGNSPSPTHPLERNGAFTEESDYTISSKGLKQLNDIFGSRDRPLSHAKLKEGRVRKGLNFSDAVENDQDLHENVNNNIQAQVLTESENDVKCDMEEALIKLQSEKEADLVQYQQSLERLSNLESEIIHAQEDSRRLSERASKAETEVHSLRSTLSMLESEREASLRVSNLEKNRTTEEDFRELNERACKAESEAHSLRQELAVAEAAKDFALDQYKQSSHVISDLEHNILIIQEEVQRLHGERDISVVKLKGSEEHALLLEESNQSLQSELSSLMQQMGVQRQELIEKQEEVGSFWNSMQEEHLRFVEVETAFQTLQHLHSQSQEELKSLTSELNNKTQTLKDVETSNWSLHGEVQKIKEDNKNLNETNLSSSLTIENMQDEITRLKEIRQKLQAEVEIRLDQGNAFQQEIFSLKEELNDLTKKHMAVLEQVESIGLNPESLSLSVKALQNENSKLKESSQREHAENISLLQKVVIMENSLADLTAELEGTKEKLTALERSFQYLMIENSNLATEKEALIAQLEKSKQDMGNLEERYIEVEEKHICLEKDKKSVLHALQDLQASLCAEKEEHANFSQLAETRLAGLELQICILQEESGRRKKQVDEELDKAVNDHIEIFILVNVIVDLKEKNSSLLIDRQKLLELSKLSEKKLLELEHENDEKQAEAELLFLQVTKMRKEMAQILVAMEIDPAHTCKDSTEQDQVNMNIMGKLENIRSSFYTILKEIEELVLEKSIILTLLREMKLEAADLDIKNRSLEQQLGDRSKQLWDLMSDTHLLKEMNEKLRHRIEDGAQKEKTLNTEVKNLGAKLFELKQAHENLQGANSKVLEEKASLAKKLLNEEEEKLALEEENYSVIGEAVSLGILCFVFRASFTEKSVELKEWTQYLEELSSINSVLEERIEKMEETLETVSIKSLLLTESLEESCNELKTVKCSCDQFHDEIASCKELLRSREMELLEAEKKLRSLQDVKVELQKAMVDLERENDGVKAINQDQEKLILEISKDSDYQKNEYRFLLEMNKKLESKLMTLQEQHKDSKEREETLISELQKKRDEIEEWETEASSFLRELQIYSVREVLFINKVHELSGTCHILESKSNSEGVEIILLKERLGVLEDENGMLKAQLTAYFPVVNSIRDCVASLESCSIRKLNTEFHNCDMDSELDHHLSGSACEYSENACVKVPDAVSSLQNLQTRLKAIEKVVTERMNATPKLDTTTRQTEKSKLKSAFPREDTNKGGDVISQQNSSNMPEPTTETSEAGNELLTKDIMLDQVTECSSHKIDGKVTADTDGQMFMPWEGTDQDGGIDGEDSREGKSPKNTCISSEKELGVDKLEISGQPTEHRRVGDQRKLLERLASDEQKLTNLQITVLDLKRKVDVSGKGKDLEYDDTVKEQIQEAEEGVLKLFDINAKLVKSIEADPEVSESERGGIIRKRRISEQSEKIERLQIEVQKIQFPLLQMDGKNRKKRKERTRRKTRAHLRDYLYGGRTSNNHKQKNACFLCMCSTSKRETD